MKKILVILGHSDKETYCGALASAYEKGAMTSGAEVKRINIGDLNFDPILHKGYKEIQALEPDLFKVQEVIRWAQHIVFVYPTWWHSMPALMKGMFDRMILPGFGFKFRKKGGLLHDKLLSGRSARIITTMDTPKIIFLLQFGESGHIAFKKGILEFCGIKPVKTTIIGSIGRISDQKRGKWLEKIENLGKKFC